MKKDKFIQVRASKNFKETLEKVSGVLQIPSAQLMRDATTEKINRLAKQNPKVAEAMALQS